MPKAILALLLCFATAWCAAAQSPRDDVVDAIEEAYRQLEYDEAASLARRALDNYSNFTVDQLTEIHTFLALIAYNRSNLREARRQFLSALQLTADLQLDPVLVPPSAQAYFEEVRTEAAVTATDTAEAPARYVLVRDPRPDAALRSMIVPGWGQLYKGQTAKAYTFAGLFAAAAGGAVLAHTRRTDAKERYEVASTVEEAERRYETYNGWHRARNGLVQGAVLVWAVSYVDALLAGPAPGTIRSLHVGGSPSSVYLRVRF